MKLAFFVQFFLEKYQQLLLQMFKIFLTERKKSLDFWYRRFDFFCCLIQNAFQSSQEMFVQSKVNYKTISNIVVLQVFLKQLQIVQYLFQLKFNRSVTTYSIVTYHLKRFSAQNNIEMLIFQKVKYLYHLNIQIVHSKSKLQLYDSLFNIRKYLG